MIACRYLSSTYGKPDTRRQHLAALNGGMAYSELAEVAGGSSSNRHPADRLARLRGTVRPSRLWAAAAVAVGVTVAGCSQPTATVGTAGGSASAGASSLADAVAYSKCVRSHGVPNFPDPVKTPDGGYGYRTVGIDPNSAAFQGALRACKAVPSPWNSTGQQLSLAQQQAWLNWAKCLRAHGLPNFPDPTFSGSEVHDSGLGSNSPQLQSAMDACMSQRPSAGGLGG